MIGKSRVTPKLKGNITAATIPKLERNAAALLFFLIKKSLIKMMLISYTDWVQKGQWLTGLQTNFGINIVLKRSFYCLLLTIFSDIMMIEITSVQFVVNHSKLKGMQTGTRILSSVF